MTDLNILGSALREVLAVLKMCDYRMVGYSITGFGPATMDEFGVLLNKIRRAQEKGERALEETMF